MTSWTKYFLCLSRSLDYSAVSKNGNGPLHRSARRRRPLLRIRKPEVRLRNVSRCVRFHRRAPVTRRVSSAHARSRAVETIYLGRVDWEKLDNIIYGFATGLMNS